MLEDPQKFSTSNFFNFLKNKRQKLAFWDLGNMERNKVRKSPLFFYSKKVQVEWPELDSGGNAQAFIVIFKYGKLEIGSRRDFRDFCHFCYLLPVFTGIEPGTLGSKGQCVIHSAMSAEGARWKNLMIQLCLVKKLFDLSLKIFLRKSLALVA